MAASANQWPRGEPGRGASLSGLPGKRDCCPSRERPVNTRDQRICLGLVPFFGALFLVGFTVFPGFFPPLSPTMTADQVAAFYRDHVGEIRASMILLNVIGIGFIPFFM